jgi:hypothetical protein
MKDETKNIKEPYNPHQTPNPPQIIDPGKRNEERNKEASVENKNQNQSDKSENAEQKKAKRLGEDEPDIHDETTI